MFMLTDNFSQLKVEFIIFKSEISTHLYYWVEGEKGGKVFFSSQGKLQMHAP